VNGPPTAPTTFHRTISPLTGEATLAPVSGSVVLNWDRTPSNGVEVKVGGNTLPTVTVVAPAATAMTSAQAAANAIARIPMRPRRPMRLRTPLRPVADMLLPSLYGLVFGNVVPPQMRGTVRCPKNPRAFGRLRRGCGTSSRRGRGLLGLRLELAPAGLFDRPFGIGERVPPVRLDRLVFEVLVDVEEVLDFFLQLSGHVIEALDVGPARIADRHADHLVVGAFLVPHLEQGDRLHRGDATGEGGLGAHHEAVERIAVLAEVAGQEAVVGRVDRGAGEEAVEDDAVEPLVVLVLVATPLGDLDEGE